MGSSSENARPLWYLTKTNMPVQSGKMPSDAKAWAHEGDSEWKALVDGKAEVKAKETKPRKATS